MGQHSVSGPPQLYFSDLTRSRPTGVWAHQWKFSLLWRTPDLRGLPLHHKSLIQLALSCHEDHKSILTNIHQIWEEIWRMLHEPARFGWHRPCPNSLILTSVGNGANKPGQLKCFVKIIEKKKKNSIARLTQYHQYMTESKHLVPKGSLSLKLFT